MQNHGGLVRFPRASTGFSSSLRSGEGEETKEACGFGCARRFTALLCLSDASLRALREQVRRPLGARRQVGSRELRAVGQLVDTRAAVRRARDLPTSVPDKARKLRGVKPKKIKTRARQRVLR